MICVHISDVLGPNFGHRPIIPKLVDNFLGQMIQYESRHLKYWDGLGPILDTTHHPKAGGRLFGADDSVWRASPKSLGCFRSRFDHFRSEFHVSPS